MAETLSLLEALKFIEQESGMNKAWEKSNHSVTPKALLWSMFRETEVELESWRHFAFNGVLHGDSVEIPRSFWGWAL